jgi:VWFA-related protein
MPFGPKPLLGFLLIAAAFTGIAQQPPPATSDLTIRTTVRRVVEDVVVTDDKGNAVHGLMLGDFLLKEDGQTQQILSFDVHDGSKPDYIPPKVPPLPPNTYVDVPGAPEQGPLYVLLYDMVNTELTDQAYARKALFKFIDNKPAGTRFAIFLNTDKTSLIQGFTQDRELLHDALTRPGPGPHLPNAFLNGGNYGKGNDGATLSLFNQLARYLDEVPGRKNLIWMSSAFPLNLYPQAGSSISQDDVKQTIALMTHAQIALYPVDLQGVQVDGGGIGGVNGGDSVGTTSPNGSNVLEGTGMTPASGHQGGTASVSQAAMQHLALDGLAEATGGHAYYSDNDITDEIDKATDAGSSYYTLSYSPSNTKEDGLQRNIKITMEETKYKAAYRRFYYLLPAEKLQPAAKAGSYAATHPVTNQADTLYANIEHGAPMLHDLIFSAHVRTDGKLKFATKQQMEQLVDEPAYFRTRHKNSSLQLPPAMKLQKYVIDYRVIDAQLKSRAAQTGKEPKLEFAAAGYDVSGRMVNGVLNDATAEPPKPGEKEAAMFRVEQEVDLPLEAAWLRVAVRDTLTDRTGTLEIHLPLKPEEPVQAAK